MQVLNIYQVRHLTIYIKTRENKVYITQGDAVISNEQKDGTNMQFDISNIENNAVLELPYIYYLGYDVTINGNKLDIYESDKGFIEVHLENVENGTVKVKYTGTNIMKISMIVSIMAFSLMILYYCRGAGIRLYNFKHK